MSEGYYLSRKKSLLRSFDRATRWVMTPLVNRYGKEFCDSVVAEARREYEALIPHIPFIGGARNRWTSDLVESVQILALFRAMQARGRTSEETAGVLYEGMRTRLAHYPRLLFRLLGMLQFSPLFLRSLQRQALATQGRAYPDNFVAEVVMGDGKEFDWGIDFTECAIQKFYVAHNGLEFLPHVCKLDYLTGEALGLGLVRTKTLADGADRCNPRLKRGGESSSWSTSR